MKPEPASTQWAYLAVHRDFPVGTLRVYDRSHQGTRTKRQMRWSVGAREDVRWLLTGVLPYLRLKKSQAELALILLDDPTAGDLAAEISALKKTGMLD